MRALAVLGIVALLAAPTAYFHYAWTSAEQEMLETARADAEFLRERLLKQDVRARSNLADAADTAEGGSSTARTISALLQQLPPMEFEGRQMVRDANGVILAQRGGVPHGPVFSVTTPLIAVNEDGREVHGLTLTPDTTEVKVRLARGLSRKVVAIQAKARSDLSPHLHLEEVVVEPSRIEIAGREELLSGIDHIETAEFSLADVKQTESRQVQLRLPEGVTVTDPNVTVTIKVGAMQ